MRGLGSSHGGTVDDEQDAHRALVTDQVIRTNQPPKSRPKARTPGRPPTPPHPLKTTPRSLRHPEGPKDTQHGGALRAEVAINSILPRAPPAHISDHSLGVTRIPQPLR